MNIILEGDEVIDTTGTHPGWWIDGNVIYQRGVTLETRYSLPKGSRRVTTERLGEGRARLILGGFKSTTFSVVGPYDAIIKLREATL
jgi:hypothetical protein